LEYLNLQFEEIESDIGGKKRRATLLNTGVPHAVIEIENLKTVRTPEVRAVVSAFRFHPRAGSAGTNVTFLQGAGQRGSDQHFSTITFERGVEDFTLSCGTGVLAAAAVGLQHSGEWVCVVDTPGGRLRASFNPGWNGARLEGPAEFVYEAKVPNDFFMT